MDFQTAQISFLRYLQVIKNASEHTIRGYRIDLESFGEFCESKKEDFS
ncbi:MAG: site-specific integrase, partial [Chlamydiota bacterium]